MGSLHAMVLLSLFFGYDMVAIMNLQPCNTGFTSQEQENLDWKCGQS